MIEIYLFDSPLYAEREMYKTGDKVRVKTWEELLATDGAFEDQGGISCRDGWFAGSMKRYCGHEFTVNIIYDTCLALLGAGGWGFQDWMLTPVEEVMETKPTTMRLNPLEHVATIDRVSVGMWVFSIKEGWVQVKNISGQNEHEIKAGQFTYCGNGRRHEPDKYPMLFLFDIFEGTSPPEPEIDWKKVPMDTDVEVRNDPKDEWRLRKFVCYLPGCGFPFLVFGDGHGMKTATGTATFGFCRLAVDCKPEWQKC